MGDVGFATVEARITEFIAEQIADSNSRTHTAVSSGAGNPHQAEEETSCIPSGDIPCELSEDNRHHSNSSSPSSSVLCTAERH